MKQVLEAINKAISEMPVVPKDSQNEQQGWGYRSIEATVDACRKIIASNGLVIIPEIQSESTSLDLVKTEYKNGGEKIRRLTTAKVMVKYTIYHTSGESITAIVPGSSEDYSDKAVGQSMTFAFKQMLSQVFMLGFEDDPDRKAEDTASVKEGKSQQNNQKPQQAKPSNPQNTQKPQAQQLPASPTEPLPLGEQASKESVKSFFANKALFKAKHGCELYKINGKYTHVEVGYYEKLTKGTGN